MKSAAPKKILFSALVAAVALSPFFAIAEKIDAAPAATAADAKKNSTPAGWTDDFEAAKKQAAEEDKDLFIVFSGSDWCSWCVRLEREILSADGFFESISENFVPVYIDQPQDQSLLSELAQKQNPELVQKYRIRGFPTVLLADADGVVFAETGYQIGGPEKYLKSVAELTEKSKASPDYKVRKAIAAVPAGKDRVKKLDGLLAAQPTEIQLSNIAAVEEVLAADPDGALGYRAKYPFFTEVLPLERQMRQTLFELSKKAQAEIDARKADAADVQKLANETLTKIITENADALAAVRAKAKALQEGFAQDSLGKKRLRETEEKITEILQRYGNEKPAEKPAEKTK